MFSNLEEMYRTKKSMSINSRNGLSDYDMPKSSSMMRKVIQPPSMDDVDESCTEPDDILQSTQHHPYSGPVESGLKIPLKYQRQKQTSQKHYKKKFRTWEYDDFEYDKDDALSNNGSVDEYANIGSHNHHHDSNSNDRQMVSPIASTFQNSQYHKSSKFRPKGKDWAHV